MTECVFCGLAEQVSTYLDMVERAVDIAGEYPYNRVIRDHQERWARIEVQGSTVTLMWPANEADEDHEHVEIPRGLFDLDPVKLTEWRINHRKKMEETERAERAELARLKAKYESKP